MSILFGQDSTNLIRDFFIETGLAQPDAVHTLLLIDMDLSRVKHLILELEQGIEYDADEGDTIEDKAQYSLGMAILSILSLGNLVGIDPIEGLAQAIVDMATCAKSSAFVCADCRRLYFNTPPRIIGDKVEDCRCEACSV